MSNPISQRYDFVYLFDVKDGNPNGDPDQANLPRVDPEDMHGIVTDVCIKRKVRNYVQIKCGHQAPFDIFIRTENILNNVIDSASGDKIEDRQKDLCKKYYDIRTFGAVMSTGDKGAGTVRGPIQLTFARSVSRIFQAEYSLTRCAVTTEKEAKAQEKREHASTFGRKATVPYGLYRMHGFVSAVDAQKCGFTEEDLELLWEALLNAFEHDRAAARGEMNPRKLIVFQHDNHLGRARSGELFEKVKVAPKGDLPRSFSDYEISVDKTMPAGVKLIEKL